MNKTVDTFRQYLRSRHIYDLNLEETLTENKGLIFTSLLLFIGVLVLRSWTNLSHPGLYAEDSIHYFNYYYGNFRTFTDIFQHPNGYYNIYNNLAAFIIAKADILLQPLLYQTVSLLLCLVTIAAFSMSGLIKSRYILFISPFFLGLTGLNHLYYYISLTFQMYVVILLLLVMLFWQRCHRLTVNILFFIIASFLIWSGPYSVLLVPFCLVFLILFKGKEYLFTALILVALAYTLSVTKSTIMLENILKPDILLLWGTTLVTKVYFLGLKSSVNAEKLILIALSLAALFWYLRRDTFFLKTSLLFGVIIVSSFAPLFLSKKYLLYQSIFPCHVLIAQFFWVGFLLYSADRIILRQERNRFVVGMAMVVAITVLIAYDNYMTSEKYRVPVLTSIPMFLQTVKEAEQQDLAAKGERVIITTNGTGVFKAAAIVGDRSPSGKLISRQHIE